jgi:hypothetical protein
MYLCVLQEESNQWAAKNFPNAQAFEPLLGIAEEYGELLESLAAGRATLELAAPADAARAETLDAISDMIIFVCDFCNKSGYSMHALLRNKGHDCVAFSDLQEIAPMRAEIASRTEAIDSLGIEIGRLAHHHLKGIQGIRGTTWEHRLAERDAVAGILIGLACLTFHLGECLDDAVEKTWATVKKRDWSNNRITGQGDGSDVAS